MIVIAVDESQKRSLRRSRRVLSKWLSQIGSRTWTGSLSQEGIQQMRSELAKAASKTTAVAVFAVRSGRRMTLLFFCGARTDWDENGWFSHKSISAKCLIDSDYLLSQVIEK